MIEKSIFDFGRPLIMAHRGESGRTPENTMLSLESAVALDVDVLESDVRLTKDNEIVLFHDDDLSRTTGREGSIRSYTLDDILQFDLGYTFTTDNGKSFPFRGKNLKIVTLQNAFERFPDVIFNLDIKDAFPSAPSELAQLISNMDRRKSVIVASFNGVQLERFRELMPDVATSAHPGEVQKFVLNTKIGLPRIKRKDIQYRAFQVPIKSGPLTIVTRKFISKAHEHNIAVHVWTINDEPTMNYLLEMGVDGIFTDQPSLLKQVLQKRGVL